MVEADPGVLRIHLASLGCAKNLVDSERLLARLATAGAWVGAAAEDADVIVINTCGFIGPAADESVATIRELAEHKRSGRCRKLLVMGCLVERSVTWLRQQLPEVDGYFGLGQHAAIAEAAGLEATPDDGARLLLTPRHTAYLRISEGCDHRCTYCTIPQIRGPFRSRPPEEILAEARQLLRLGAIELNVIGQDTTAYGVDLPGGPSVDELLARLADLPGLRWLRLLYTHPARFTDRLVEAFATIDRLCRYVDLPLQHLDDDILRRMGRRVTQRDCLRLIDQLRSRVPGVAIRTTFIVGFPGETEEQFDELVAQVERIRFDHLGVFRYSNEAGTPAAELPDQLPERIKARRQEELMLVQREIARAKARSMLGRAVELLVDRSTSESGTWIGRTASQAPDVDSVTFVHGDGIIVGDITEAQIVDAAGYDLIARA